MTKSMSLALISLLTLSAETRGGGDTLENPSTQSPTLSTQQTPQTIAKDKSGFTFGIEANFAQNTIHQQSIFLAGTGLIDTNLKKIHFGFDGGIKFGYQHYFDKEALGVQKAFGINASIYIGAGIPLKETISSRVLHSSIYYGSESEYVPIKTRIEVSFLWDFWESGEHTLGLSAGVGYGFSYYLSTKTKNNVLFDNQPHPDGESTKFLNTFINSFYPQIGLYYYYGNHQFSLNYRFSLEYSSNTQKVEFMSGANDVGHIFTQISQNDHLSIGYSYRF